MLSLKKILTKILQSVVSLQTVIEHGSGTYTSQNYVTQTDYNSIRLYQQAGTRMGILAFNLQITTALPLNTYVTIGTLPVSPSVSINVIVPPQTTGCGNLYLFISKDDGAVKLYGARGYDYVGRYRSVIPVILPYAES